MESTEMTQAELIKRIEELREETDYMYYGLNDIQAIYINVERLGSGTCVLGLELKIGGRVLIRQFTQGNLAPETAMDEAMDFLKSRGHNPIMNYGSMD
jgi:hypothetical protein